MKTDEWTAEDYGRAADALELCPNDMTVEERAKAVLDSARSRIRRESWAWLNDIECEFVHDGVYSVSGARNFIARLRGEQ